MVIIEFIVELIARIFVEIIFEGIILRTINALNNGLTSIWHKITGQKNRNKPNPKTQLERQLLYKKIELTDNLNSSLRKGLHGVVLEIIDKDRVYAEFYGPNNRPIEVDNVLVFEVGLNQFRLIK